MKKSAAVCCLAVLCLTLFSCAPRPFQNESFAMNTFVLQTVYARDDAVIAQNNQILRTLENKLSKTLETSDVWALNHSDGRPVRVSDDTAAVLRASLDAAYATDGAFDPALGNLRDAWGFGTDGTRVPAPAEIERLLASADYTGIVIDGNTVETGGAGIDLGGSAKGYALDVLRDNLAKNGVESALVSVGGSIYARGVRPDGGKWSVGIRNPLGDASSYLGTIAISDLCVSTSGVYEQGFTENSVYYHHLLDPSTGYPSENGLLSVLVADESGIRTDLYSTALFVMGLPDGLAYANANGIDALFITRDKRIVRSDGFDYGFTIGNTEYHEG